MIDVDENVVVNFHHFTSEVEVRIEEYKILRTTFARFAETTDSEKIDRM